MGSLCRIRFVTMERAPVDDAMLVNAVAANDEVAMADLYERHGSSVYGLALRVLGDTGRAQDVLQDVFVRLWQRPDRFDPTRGSLRSFLLRDAHGRSLDRLRSDGARTRREQRHEGDRSISLRDQDLEREVEGLLRHEQLRDVVGSLGPREREAITLAYFNGHSYREVARLLGEPEGTIKSRIRLGLRHIADKLDEAGLGAER